MDKAILAAIVAAILAAMIGGFSYIWGHVERNAVNSRTARVIQKEVIRPRLKDFEKRIRSLERCK